MEHLPVNFMLLTVGALVAILNPFGILPQFLSFTDDLTEEELKHTTKRAILTAGSVLISVSVIGTLILQFFKITIPAFKIAGGIILFKIALDMLYVRMMRSVTSDREFRAGVSKEDVSIFPLAIPFISGPGSITTVIMLADEAGSIFEHAFIIISLLISAVVLYFILIQAKKINDYLGQIGVNVMTRLMGIILAAIAAQFIIDGAGQTINNYLSFNIELYKTLTSKPLV